MRANCSLKVMNTPFKRLAQKSKNHPMIHPKGVLERLKLKYINNTNVIIT